jgi:signal transduction histidine kinase
VPDGTPSKPGAGPAGSGMRLVLFAGFGGLLVLMTLAGAAFVRRLHQLQVDDAQLAQSYIRRHRLLEQIRSSLYLSGTFVRDYLLDTDPNAARSSRAALYRVRENMQAMIRRYSQSIRPEEKAPFSILISDIDGYWDAVRPVFQWGREERRARAAEFLQAQVLPRRALMMGIADKIDALNAQGLADGAGRATGLFTRLRRTVMAILGLVLCAGTALSMASILHILRVEKQGRVRFEEVRQAQEELKRLSARLVDMQEQERRAISRELHDRVGQSLNALRVDLSNLAAITPAGNREAHRFLQTARGLADESVNELRNLALLLRPSMLDDLGLVPALGWQAREVFRRTGLPVDLAADDVPEGLPDEHKTCIYRVVQEALHNASRHAGAHKVQIAVRREEQHLLLTVQDDGKGFDPRVVRGLGLLGMAERVKHLSGTFEVRSGPGRGTLLTVRLPLITAAASTPSQEPYEQNPGCAG